MRIIHCASALTGVAGLASWLCRVEILCEIGISWPSVGARKSARRNVNKHGGFFSLLEYVEAYAIIHVRASSAHRGISACIFREIGGGKWAVIVLNINKQSGLQHWLAVKYPPNAAWHGGVGINAVRKILFYRMWRSKNCRGRGIK